MILIRFLASDLSSRIFWTADLGVDRSSWRVVIELV